MIFGLITGRASAALADELGAARLLHCRGGMLRIAVASTFAQRLRGLLGRAPLDRGEALLITRCRAVHTFGMRVALDLVFVDRFARVVRIDRDVKPGRIRLCRRASALLELGCGDAARLELRPGDALAGAPASHGGTHD